MQKLKLDLDALEVQSFATTGAAGGAAGTVHGMIVSTDDPMGCNEPIFMNAALCPSFGCPTAIGMDSCDGTCGNSCGNSCGSCYGSCNFDCPSDGCVSNGTSYGYTFLVSCCPPTR
jgi:hypothetical protein